MNKSVKRISCLFLAAATALPLVGCGEDKKNDTETRPVVFAIEAVDGTFNPFFATSAPDSEIANMTQLGMLTTDENGNILCGENEPTVALEFKKTEAEDQSYTDYEFVIKNDIKFSDGTDLTIKDVLFNLYVYLDPSYMGSATMYSTDIVGLKKYRAQDPDLIEDSFSESELNSRFYGIAIARQDDMIAYLDGDANTTYTRSEEEIKKDIELLKELFKEEVETDWTTSQGGLEGFKDEYTFTESWQVYYYSEGIVKVQVNDTTKKPLRDKDGKYITNITPAGVIMEDGNEYDGSKYNKSLVDEIVAAQNDTAALQKYIDKGASAEDAKIFVTRDFATNVVYENYTAIDAGIIEILQYWATGANLLDKFVAEARTDAYENLKNEDGSLAVPNISGITTSKKKVDGEQHDVLNIRINGIDPKAEYNFAFAVAPMHYYSGTFEGVDYVKAAMEDTNHEKNFGVAFNNNQFFEKVLKAPEKNAKPVGAGAYQASNQKFATENVKGEDFYSNNWVYFARNNYFETVGDEIENAKIKYLHYKVVSSDMLIQALEAGDIDVGEPNATAANISTMSQIAHINQKTVDTNGYGYVGINPKYVPDIEVRKVIMAAMDTLNCLNYYTSEYASLIYRSMSKASWIWKYGGEEGEMPTTPYYTLTDWTAAEVQGRLKNWELNGNGKLVNKETGEPLKLTFTIAGATTDHPAYTMFSEAAEFLNSCGFDITVTTDIAALKKLSTGQLAVWAAAWSSTVDPDMYQVYHRDSNATSTKNWGYDTIFGDSKYSKEQGIINALSDLIEQGRETNDQETRAGIYKEALTLVMDLAVEMPTYQRKDCVAYNNTVIDPKSLNQNPTAFSGVIDKVWELNYI